MLLARKGKLQLGDRMSRWWKSVRVSASVPFELRGRGGQYGGIAAIWTYLDALSSDFAQHHELTRVQQGKSKMNMMGILIALMATTTVAFAGEPQSRKQCKLPEPRMERRRQFMLSVAFAFRL